MSASDTRPIASTYWQLFIDDHAVARATGFDRVVHHPRAMGVVIPADRPWETAGIQPLLVERRSDESFVCFYTSMWWDIDRAAELGPGFREDRAHHILHRIGYAASADGVRWDKPELGLVEAPAGIDPAKYAPFPAPVGSSTRNNLGVPFVPVANLGAHGEVSDPARRYALRLAPEDSAGVGAAWTAAPRGYFASDLPDFLSDPGWRAKLVDSGGNFNPRRSCLHYWDEIHEEWVAIDQGVVGHWIPSREIARFASKDLVNWTSTSVLYPDALDPHRQDRYDEPMTMVPFCAEGVVFGLLSWFHSDRTHPDAGPVFDPTPEHPNRWPWCRKGTNEMRITISRDGGYTWDRASSREAWIPHGPEEDSYDRLVIVPVPPVRVGDEDWFYVDVINGDHLGIRNDPGQTPYYHGRLPRHQIALYVQRHNRYVSLSTQSYAEMLITTPVEVTGGTLELNVDASRGRVRVALAAAEPVPTFNGATPTTAPHMYEGRALPGFGFDDSPAVLADAVAHPVAFASGLHAQIAEPVAFASDLNALRGKPVRLLFEVTNADLYGFRFRE